MNTITKISLSLGVVAFIFINVFFEIRFFQGISKFFLDLFDTITDFIGDYNTKRYLERVKKEKIVRQKENVFAKYNRLVEGLIIDFKLPLTLESFTSLLCILFSISMMIIVLFMKNITLSFVVTLSVFIAILTLFVMQSKAIKAERVENIMTAEEVLCPLARHGVLVAIKKVMESEEYISPNIRPYFQQFIDNCENNGYTFKQAITLLNKQLGPKFDNFTKKAIIFEYNERKGMADIFLDIIDENAVLREINTRKDRIFRKMNRDFLLKTIIILLFFLYASTVQEFREFMLYNDLGKFINTIIISVVCISFARCQMLQGDLGIGGDKK
ncbi:hypothetical protein [Alkaliphilus transvaalensis]|uniref:hypothetical protein n=1 Tax=Alkaliphilus transvaalensis TaxID=114628 RepID=UPI0004791AAB|nr:hypothetical protein [Alkaliphilus transvaalensis]